MLDTLLAQVAALVGGLVLLTLSADRLVAAAVRLGALLRLPPAAVALTVVAAGTSLPELVVSLRAAMDGSADLAAANVVGSNLSNIGLILGLSALIRPLPVHASTLRRDGVLMVGACLAVVALGWDGGLSRLDGAALLAAAVPWLWVLIRQGGDEEVVAEGWGWGRTLLYVALAIAGLGVGAQLFLGGAIAIATGAGVSERVIGLTLVSLGTSLPELATSLLAAFRGRTDVAVGNIVGSNIFNVLGILGLTALLEPLQVAPALLRGDAVWMSGLAVLLLPMLWTGRRVSRAEGVVLLGATGAWLATLL